MLGTKIELVVIFISRFFTIQLQYDNWDEPIDTTDTSHLSYKNICVLIFLIYVRNSLKMYPITMTGLLTFSHIVVSLVFSAAAILAWRFCLM